MEEQQTLSTLNESIEYKGYYLSPFMWKYGNEKEFVTYEIKRDVDNATIIYYKNNGVVPLSATIADSTWDSIEQAKHAIDNNGLIKGGAFLTDKNGHVRWAVFKSRGRIWTCDKCGKQHFDDIIKPFADFETWGVVCKDCFSDIMERGKELQYTLAPTEYHVDIIE